MDVTLTTKVVSFGAGGGVDTGSTKLVVDTVKIAEVYGEDKSGFYPEDDVWVLLYLDPDYVFVDCKLSSGSIVANGTITREVTERVQVPLLYSDTVKSPPTLNYIPSFDVSFLWYGNSPTIKMDGDKVKAVSGDIPAIGEATYDTRPLQFKVTPPPLTLGEDEVYPILVVVYVE